MDGEDTTGRLAELASTNASLAVRNRWRRAVLAWLPVLAIFSFALGAPPAAGAAEPDNAALRQEIKSLREMVVDLQARVARLEGHPAPAVPTASVGPSAAPAAPQAVPAAPRAEPEALGQPTGAAGADSPQAVLRRNWLQIRPDMDQSEVARLLGPPSRSFTIDSRPVWYYVYPTMGNGSVFFNAAGRVSSRQSPFGWGG